MNGLPYYKAYPRDFIEGTVGMSFELKGAYRLVLDLIYMQGGELPDDARYISGLLGCSVKKWNTLREKLIELGKLTVIGEFLTNDRAISEVETLGKLRDKNRENRARPNKNNEMQSRPDYKPEPEPESEPEEHNQRSIPTPREPAALPSVDELKLLSERMFAAAGSALASEAIAPGLASMMIPQMWLDQGCDLALDALPAVKYVASKSRQKIRSWDYFTGAVHEARDKRLAGKPRQTAKIIPIVRDMTEDELEIAREESRAVIRAAQARMAKCAQFQTSPTSTDWKSEAKEMAGNTRSARNAHPFDLPTESAESACPY